MSNKDDFFSEENEAKSTWFKFEKIGDTIKGTLIGKSVKPARDMFPEQEVYELKTEDGEVWNVASSKDFVRKSMKRAKLGQIVGFKYDSDYQTEANKKKGMAPAKTIKVYHGEMDPNYSQMDTLQEQFGGEEVKDEGPKVDDIPFD